MTGWNEPESERMYLLIILFFISPLSRFTIDMVAKCDKHTMNVMNALQTGYHDYNIVQLLVFLLLQCFGQMNYYFASCSNRNKWNRRYICFALIIAKVLIGSAKTRSRTMKEERMGNSHRGCGAWCGKHKNRKVVSKWLVKWFSDITLDRMHHHTTVDTATLRCHSFTLSLSLHLSHLLSLFIYHLSHSLWIQLLNCYYPFPVQRTHCGNCKCDGMCANEFVQSRAQRGKTNVQPLVYWLQNCIQSKRKLESINRLKIKRIEIQNSIYCCSI